MLWAGWPLFPGPGDTEQGAKVTRAAGQGSAWAAEITTCNFFNHCECDPDCHCLRMYLRLSFHGPE